MILIPYIVDTNKDI